MRRGASRSYIGYLGTLALIFSPVALFSDNQYYLSIAVGVGMVAVPAVGAWLVLAGGLWSFGQGAFATLGAYTAALLVMRSGAPFGVAFVAGGVCAGACALLVAYPFLRTSGVAFSIVTLVGLLALEETILLVPSLTGGGGGLIGVPPAPVVSIVGWRLDLSGGVGAYLLIAIVLVLTLAAIERLRRGGFLRILIAIAQQEALAESLGIPTKRFRASAWVFAGSVTGLAGAFSASYLQVAHPSVWDLFPSIYIVTYAIIGGSRAVLGPVIGAAAILVSSAALSSVGVGNTTSVEPIVIGAGLIIVTLAFPGGLVDIVSHARRLVRRVRFGSGAGEGRDGSVPGVTVE